MCDYKEYLRTHCPAPPHCRRRCRALLEVLLRASSIASPDSPSCPSPGSRGSLACTAACSAPVVAAFPCALRVCTARMRTDAPSHPPPPACTLPLSSFQQQQLVFSLFMYACVSATPRVPVFFAQCTFTRRWQNHASRLLWQAPALPVRGEGGEGYVFCAHTSPPLLHAHTSPPRIPHFPRGSASVVCLRVPVAGQFILAHTPSFLSLSAPRGDHHHGCDHGPFAHRPI